MHTLRRGLVTLLSLGLPLAVLAPVTPTATAAPLSSVASAVARPHTAASSASAARTWYHREVIGHSAAGRPIVAYRAGQPGKPVVMVLSVMHGEEQFARHVSLGLLKGRKITGVDLWVVPVVNPDGYAHDRRWLAHGVDSNRNYPNRWIKWPHSGPKAASAVETRVMMRFLGRIRPKYVVSWHQPLFGVDSYKVKNTRLMHQLSSRLHIPIKRLDCHGGCHGTLTGWYNTNYAGAAITVEYGSTSRSVARMEGHDADAVLHALGGRRA